MSSASTALQVTLVSLVSHAHQNVAQSRYFPTIDEHARRRQPDRLAERTNSWGGDLVVHGIMAFFVGKYYAVRAKKTEEGDKSLVTWEEFWKSSPPKDGDLNGPKSRVRCMCC